MTRRLPLLCLAALLSGCVSAPKPHYYWGNYEGLIYEQYSEPGKYPPAKEIQTMLADMEKAKAKNLPLPPGFHAYLGTLYVQDGQPDKAGEQFLAEKAEFPESAILMDRLLAKVQPPAAANITTSLTPTTSKETNTTLTTATPPLINELKLGDGAIYTGDIVNGMADGHGTVVWPNGQKYIGDFKSNKPNGAGTYTWPNGEKYEGECKDNQLDGVGTLTHADGTKITGLWKNGEYVGPVNGT